MDPIQVIILAAGKKTWSSLPTALVPVDHIPMIVRIINTILDCRTSVHKLTIVVRPDEKLLIQRECDRYMSYLHRHNVDWVVQNDDLDGCGTGGALHAVVRTNRFDAHSNALVINSDTPLIDGDSIDGFIGALKKTTDLLVGTCFLRNVNGYGRISREKNNRMRIIEQSQVDSVGPDHKWHSLREVNVGIMIIRPQLAVKIKTVNGPEKKITDLALMAENAEVFPLFKDTESININTETDLNYADYILSQRRHDTLQRTFMTLVRRKFN